MLPMRKYYELENLVKLDEHSVDTNLGLLKTSVATPSDPKEEKKSVIQLLNDIKNPNKKLNKLEDLFDTSLSQLNSDEFIMDLESFQKTAIQFPTNKNFDLQMVSIYETPLKFLAIKFPLFKSNYLTRNRGYQGEGYY